MLWEHRPPFFWRGGGGGRLFSNSSHKIITKPVRLTNWYLAVSQKNKPLFHSIPHHDQQPGKRTTNERISSYDYHTTAVPDSTTF